MTNKYWFLSFLFLAPVAFAADDAPQSNACVQVIQPAVNADGKCEIFPTPCSVPEGWKKISSCDLIQPEEFGLSPEEVSRRRQMRRIQALKEKAKEKEAEAEEASPYRIGAPRIGRARFTRSDRLQQSQSVDSNKSESHFSQRGRNIPQFGNRQAYQRYRRLSLNQANFKNERTRVEKYQEKVQTRGRRRPAIMGSTDANRQGYLSNESFLERRKLHNKRELGDERYWKSPEYIDRTPDKKRVYEGPTLRKIYRPSQEGNLEGKDLLE
ncbi:hypothetical protein K9M59_04090 [Candidatus Gracilibacteria bacterium]|nr:hypothetical protein [Candidatus Gracilibacteria bacterium]MCF7819503.1 hypothetical protein [Candidatus Gracilibacteria bacterium]